MNNPVTLDLNDLNVQDDISNTINAVYELTKGMLATETSRIILAVALETLLQETLDKINLKSSIKQLAGDQAVNEDDDSTLQ